MLLTDAVMCIEQPGLQIGEGDVNHRQVGVGLFSVAIEYHGLVRVLSQSLFLMNVESCRSLNQ